MVCSRWRFPRKCSIIDFRLVVTTPLPLGNLSNKFWTNQHMFQLCRFKRKAPGLKWQLPSRFEMILAWMSNIYEFQVDHAFHKLDVKILANSNKIRCVSCSGDNLHHEQWICSSKRRERVWEPIVCDLKCAVKSDRLVLKFRKVLAKAMLNLKFLGII